MKDKMDKLTEKQLKRYQIYLYKNDPTQVKNFILQRFKKPFEELTKKEAGRALDLLFGWFHPKSVIKGYVAIIDYKD